MGRNMPPCHAMTDSVSGSPNGFTKLGCTSLQEFPQTQTRTGFNQERARFRLSDSVNAFS